MRIVSLASGSRGNAYVVSCGDVGVLIDCGLNCKTLKARLADASIDPDGIAAILLTHSHIDHTCGLRTLLSRRPDICIYANAMTAETDSHECKIADDAFACFENGQSFEIGPFEIQAFSIPHDTSDPVGFQIREMTPENECRSTYFHGTDIGSPLDSIGLKLAEADVATLESNHDPVLLSTSGRPPSLIQRIRGPRGHLANEDACELVRRFASPKLKTLALAHLSRECNAPHVAERAMKTALVGMGRMDVTLKVLSQDEPMEIL